MNHTNCTLREFQLKLLENLLTLDEFLKENNIKYFLVGGSTLGAVRHKGFIPWDDDIDIGMMREDFERFEKLDFSKLNAKKLQYCRIGKNVILNAPIGFLYDRSNPETPYEECPTIDIFPIDYVPQSKIKQKIQKIISLSYHLAIGRRPAQNRGRKAKLFTAVILKITPGFMLTLYAKFAKLEMIKLGEKQSGLVANIFGQQLYDREVMPRDYIKEIIEAPFEGHLLPIQKNYHEYLSHVYGDYMKLPPMDKRKPHHKIFKQ